MIIYTSLFSVVKQNLLFHKCMKMNFFNNNYQN